MVTKKEDPYYSNTKGRGEEGSRTQASSIQAAQAAEVVGTAHAATIAAADAPGATTTAHCPDPRAARLDPLAVQLDQLLLGVMRRTPH